MILPDVLQKMTDEEFLLCVFGIIRRELGLNGLERFLKTFRNGGDAQVFTFEDIVARLDAQKEGECASISEVPGG